MVSSPEPRRTTHLSLYCGSDRITLKNHGQQKSATIHLSAGSKKGTFYNKKAEEIEVGEEKKTRSV
jgi:hypothetical protein